MAGILKEEIQALGIFPPESTRESSQKTIRARVKTGYPTGFTAYLALRLERAKASMESRFALMRPKSTGRVQILSERSTLVKNKNLLPPTGNGNPFKEDAGRKCFFESITFCVLSRAYLIRFQVCCTDDPATDEFLLVNVSTSPFSVKGRC